MSADYYDIACEDLQFLQNGLSMPTYNTITVMAQQITEKMLKSVAERACVGVEGLLHTHNLRALYDCIHKEIPSFLLDRGMLSVLKDLYFDAKYPGDNYVKVSREECQEYLCIMYDTIEQTNEFRSSLHLKTVNIKRIDLGGVTRMTVF